MSSNFKEVSLYKGDYVRVFLGGELVVDCVPATVIAAAPELLEALRLALTVIECQVPGNPGAEYCDCGGCRVARLSMIAIAKAEDA